MRAFIIIAIVYCISRSDGKAHLSKRNSALHTSLIVGGQAVTDIKQYPYMASILVSTDRIKYFTLCGGSILSPAYILTAGRCLKDFPKNISVHVGTLTLLNGTQYQTHRYAIHPLYNTTSEEYNSGLVIMEQPMKLDGVTAKPVVLAKEGTTVKPGSEISLAGWGAQNESYIQTGNPGLRAVKIPVINSDVCSNLYGVGSNLEITDNVFCAADLDNGGKDACRGDWGDPAMQNGVQVGISSSGVWCGHAESPGTYTLVASIRPWLKIVAGI